MADSTETPIVASAAPEKKLNSKDRNQRYRYDKLKANTKAMWTAKADAKYKQDLDPLHLEERITKEVAAATAVITNPLPVSTRSIGLHMHVFLSELYTLRQNLALTPEQIYASYRVLLAKASAKIQSCGIPTNGPELTDRIRLPEEMRVDLAGVVYLPVTMGPILSAIGKVEYYGNVYLPCVPAHPRVVGLMVPRPDSLTITNLREVVMALANVNIPQATRASFFAANPIPLAVVQNDLLINPDAIMPAVYNEQNLRADIQMYKQLITSAQDKVGKLVCTADPSREANTAALLFTRTHDPDDIVRVPIIDVALQQNQLADYYMTHAYLGVSNRIHTQMDTAGSHAMVGSISLLGEVLPLYPSPIHAMRSPFVGCRTVVDPLRARLSAFYS